MIRQFIFNFKLEFLNNKMMFLIKISTCIGVFLNLMYEAVYIPGV